MRPGAYDLELYRGDTYAWRFLVWTDQAGTQPADLTGVTVKAEIRDQPGGTIQVALPCVVTLPNTIDMTLSTWTTFTRRSAVWDLQLTYPDTSVVTILAGKVTVTPDVTDSTIITTNAARAARLASMAGAS